MRTRWLALLVMGLSIAVLTACGGSSSVDNMGSATAPSALATRADDPTATGGTTVNVVARDFAFALDRAQMSAGPVTFVLTNNGSSPHDFEIKGNGVDKKTALIDKGKNASLTVELKAGTYTYRCDVPGHDMLGMKGTLTVE